MPRTHCYCYTIIIIIIIIIITVIVVAVIVVGHLDALHWWLVDDFIASFSCTKPHKITERLFFL
jgi:hypothetical protein